MSGAFVYDDARTPLGRYGGALAGVRPDDLGALALGASGGRIVNQLARELRRRGSRWGLAALCIGVGEGLAVVLEATS